MAHAIVFGASGLAGWAVVDQLLQGYPNKGTFNNVTAIFNRPMTFEQSCWPDPTPTGIDVQLEYGIDLTRTSSADVTASIKEKVNKIETVTHAYYFAYKGPSDPSNLQEEVEVNGRMLQNVVDALCDLAPKLQFITLLTGAKAYGVTLPDRLLQAPFDETMVLPEPAKSLTFYTSYRRTLTEASARKGQHWTWTDIRPDLIVGFDPNGSHFNLTALWGRYLSTYALVHGKGSKITFPGVEAAYNCPATNCSAELIARVSIWASLHPEICGRGEAFNVADSHKSNTFADIWPALASYFGLEGISPSEGGLKSAEDIEVPGVFLDKHRQVLEEAGVKGLEGNKTFQSPMLDFFGVFITHDITLNVEKLRRAGFEEEVDHVQSWSRSWDKFKRYGMLPA